ncbi:NUDIX domain-containing protein [Tenggerimyces flavus]|uniref:NUDIX domain-containing protein n=1 Tax=Tenggerimyces flavus TaxID=1708749 RepID=A0ABV7YAL7_9ACTN
MTSTQRVVLLQRGLKAKFAQGMWDLPVGKNDPGEPITATAIRELREEAGLHVDRGDLRLAHVIHGARGSKHPMDSSRSSSPVTIGLERSPTVNPTSTPKSPGSPPMKSQASSSPPQPPPSAAT